MNMTMIDQELMTLTEQLKELNKLVRRSSSEKYDRIAAEHKTVRAMEAEIMSKVRLLEQNSRRASLVGQQDAVILHYCSRLALQMKHYLSLAHSAFSKITWLKILQKRANTHQTGQKVSEIQEEQLLSVFSRQQELEQAKSFLLKKLEEQNEQKIELERQFQVLQIIRENRLASASLQLRLGNSTEDAMSSPLLKTLKDILKGYCLPALQPRLFKEMHASLLAYQKTATSYLEQSRLEAMASLDHGALRSATLSPSTSHNGQNSFLTAKQSIRERLTKSKNDYQERQKELDSLHFPNPVLKLMQNP